MTPTIDVSDRVLVLKNDIVDINYKLGDIVVFYNPNNYTKKSYLDKFIYSLKIGVFMQNDISSEAPYIKRIIGLPGDQIDIDNLGNIYRNNQLLTFEGILNETYSNNENYTIPENNFFLMGDNRANSQDSRTFGYVPFENLIGKAIYKVYPYENIGSLND
jgi:signal peptidase I